MYVHNAWYVGAISTEVKDTPLARTILDQPIVFFRQSTGAIAALEDRCVHRQVPLSMGKVVDDTLQCTYHGLQFNRDGRCVRIPSQNEIPAAARVKSYPIVERYGFIFIWMGESERASTTPPFEFAWPDNDSIRMMHNRLHARFDYRLLIDNLMDVTHLPFAHATTIGALGVAEDFTARLEPHADGVRISRWMNDIDQAPAHAEASGYTGKVDRWQIITYCPPSSVWLQVGTAVAGRGGREAKGTDLLIDRNTVHILTPETKNAAHYFWITSHKVGALTPAQEQTMFERSIEAFNEDLVIIEAQSARLDPHSPTIDISADAAANAARKILENAIKAEAEAG